MKRTWRNLGGLLVIALTFGSVFLILHQKAPTMKSGNESPSSFLGRAETMMSDALASNQAAPRHEKSGDEKPDSLLAENNLPADMPDIEGVELMRAPPSGKVFREISSLFGYSKLEKSITTEPNASGSFLKVDIFRTDFKYPLIRVAERWEGDASGASEGQLTARSAMVADHLIVKWAPGADPVEVNTFLEKTEATIRSADDDSNIMLVSFDGEDPRALGKFLKTFQKSSLVESATPDYLATNDPDAQ